MKKDRVTRDDVRNIEVGQVGIFTLPDRLAVFNAQVTISTMKRLYGFAFERIETGKPLTIAYKRIK